MSDILYREIEVRDLNDYRALRLQGLIEHPDAFGEPAESFKRKTQEDLANKLLDLVSNSGFILGSFHEDRLVGTVAFRREVEVHSRHIGILWGMYVLPGYRNKKVGHRLVDLLLTKALSIPDLEQIRLTVTANNNPAVSLYQQFNFKITDTNINVHRANSMFYDEYLMVRELKFKQSF